MPFSLPPFFCHWWKSLLADEHILDTTAAWFADPALVPRAARFVRDILAADLPAEVFVQRPALLQAVVHGLVAAAPPPRAGNNEDHAGVLACLDGLVARLARRVHDRRDPASLGNGYGSVFGGRSKGSLPAPLPLTARCVPFVAFLASPRVDRPEPGGAGATMAAGEPVTGAALLALCWRVCRTLQPLLRAPVEVRGGRGAGSWVGRKRVLLSFALSGSRASCPGCFGPALGRRVGPGPLPFGALTPRLWLGYVWSAAHRRVRAAGAPHPGADGRCHARGAHG